MKAGPNPASNLIQLAGYWNDRPKSIPSKVSYDDDDHDDEKLTDSGLDALNTSGCKKM